VVTSAIEYNPAMRIGKLLKVGTSYAVVVARPNMRMLGWQPGDVLAQAIVDDQLVLQNISRPAIRFVRTRKEYGDASIDRP
jgi:hypothetical protein